VCVDVEMPLTESNEGKVPPASWPSHGAVSFKKLCVTYAPELPDVLLNVSFDIEPGMRVGIVGTTGSGKSTLALTLFRAMDPRDGSIEIDGEDIAGVRLKELRKRLNMVVQDGSLNSGTLRDALDITHSKGKIIASIRKKLIRCLDDWEVYEALQRVHLLPEDLAEEDLKENPFSNLDTFVAVGKSFPLVPDDSISDYELIRGGQLQSRTAATTVLGQSTIEEVEDLGDGRGYVGFLLDRPVEGGERADRCSPPSATSSVDFE